MTKRKVEKLEKDLAEQKQALNEMRRRFSRNDSRSSICVRGKEITVRKPKVVADISSKTVLTDSTWQYVEIYLKSMNQNEALFFWQQARNFYEATTSLSLVSKPLTAYYCFLNATKALLEAKSCGYDLSHGVTGKRLDGHVNILNEVVKFQPRGVGAALGNYLGERTPEGGQEFTLKQIFYNLAYIHRAFTISYGNMAELFIPVLEPRFVFDKYRKKAWLEIKLEEEHSSKRTLSRLIGYSLDKFYDNDSQYTLRRNKVFDWDAPRGVPTPDSLGKLHSYHKARRKELRYIYSPNSLWYVKRKDLKNDIIDKSTLTLTYAAMHRLSELSRYNPQVLDKHLSKDSSWLISEFINKSIYQFIDQVSSEITGNDFRVTGFRE